MSEKIIWGGMDPFTHMVCVGPPRSGKSSTILLPMIYQLLLQKKKGKKVGLSVIEPKGDLAKEVKEFCDEMEIPYVYIDPDSDDSHRFNVMEGNTDDVAEATVAVLQSLFGKQEAFFQTVQELSARNITKLLKELHGDNIDLLDVIITLRSPQILEKKVVELKQRQGQSELVDFFENELLGSLGEKYRQLVIGLRAQLENITGNAKLKKIITGKSDINIDKHFEEGGVLIVNTALGSLKKAGDAFGQFVAMHLQSGTFRRKGTEQTRVPHFLIIDEYSRYINPDVEMFLSVAASYRVAGILATQSLGQLEIESGKISARAMKQAILGSCRNKIAFGGLSAQDAKEFAEEFGMDQVIMRQTTFRNRILLPNFFPDSYRDTESEQFRFHYTYLQDEMDRFHFIARLLKDGTPQKPIEGVGQFVPRDWKEKREWESEVTNKKKKTNSSSLFTSLKGLVNKQVEKRKQTKKAVLEENNLVDVYVPDEEIEMMEPNLESKAVLNEQESDPDPYNLNDSQNKSHLEIEKVVHLQSIPNKRDLEINSGEKVPVKVLEKVKETATNQVAATIVPKGNVTESENDENVYNDDDFWS